jgi:hypothetical protein
MRHQHHSLASPHFRRILIISLLVTMQGPTELQIMGPAACGAKLQFFPQIIRLLGGCTCTWAADPHANQS